MVVEKVLSFILKNSLIAADENVVVGVSGGPDSVCLVHVLNRLKGRLGFKLHVAHLNHSLRGQEADVEAEYVRSLSTSLGLPFTIDKRDVKAYQEEHHLSVEEAAREVRYGFLAEVAEALGGAKVAVGHTADDQVETILMHIVRGTGISGLVGMDPSSVLHIPRLQREIAIVRPLLEISRQETENYCEKAGLSPHYDATNYSRSFLRNRIRAELVPLLQSYNPAAKAAIQRMARLAKEDLEYIEDQVERLWPQVAEVENGLAILNTALIRDLHPSLQRYILRRAAEEVLGDVVDIEAVHVEDMRKAMLKPVGTRISLPRELLFQVGYDACFISRGPLQSSPWPLLDGEYSLKIPGETDLPGWIVRAEVVDGQIAATHPTSAWQAHLDLTKASDLLSVRGRKPGDRFQPLGMSEPKKLQDFMVDAKIPRAWRDGIPLVVSPQQIVWLVGWRIDERVKVDDNSRTVLCLTFEPKARGGETSGN